MKLTYLSADHCEFPPTYLALNEPKGLLAAGGALTPEWILTAYKNGIFPWFQDGQPILWWSPDPRTVLFTDRIHRSSSMEKFVRKSNWQVVLDRDFQKVIGLCGDTRASTKGTWITDGIKQAYSQLHDMGFAHSVEVYDQHRLVGGLYGMALGGIFYGESMFSLESNASKMAIITLGRFLQRNNFCFVDCQVASDHLFSLGAEEISRSQFEGFLETWTTIANIQHYQPIWQKAVNKVISKDGYIFD